jgi:hypothetical protein
MSRLKLRITKSFANSFANEASQGQFGRAPKAAYTLNPREALTVFY